MIRVLIVDDENPARREMRRLLNAHPDVEIVGEACCAEDAVKQSMELEPDVTFLDIMMPDRSGLEIAGELIDSARKIVFVTAFDAHAVRAFDLNAVDYLLKPVEPERLARTLDRIRSGTENEVTSSHALKEGDSIFLRGPDRGWFTRIDSIRLLETEGNYTRVFFDEEQPLVTRSLNALEQKLPPQMFFRANRSQIVNVRWIVSADTWFSGSLRIRLRDDTKIELSRRQSQIFRDQFGL